MSSPAYLAILRSYGPEMLRWNAVPFSDSFWYKSDESVIVIGTSRMSLIVIGTSRMSQSDFGGL